MKPFLTYAVYAPIGAMGAMVAGNNRYGWDRPAQSAIFGMIAATLGIDRMDDERHLTLQSDIGTAVFVNSPGRPFMDFHTAQVPAGDRKFQTRREQVLALAEGDTTIVSMREYRTEVSFLVALWERREGGEFSLPALRDAMLRPAYAPFLGRVSCPLGLPFAPAIAEAEGPVEALLQRRDGGPETTFFASLRGRAPTIISMDAQDAPDTVIRIETRTDRIISRKRWQFVPRAEAIIPVV